MVPYDVVRSVLFVVRSTGVDSCRIVFGAIRSVFMVYVQVLGVQYREIQFLCSVLSMVQYAYGMVVNGMIWRGALSMVWSVEYCLFTESYDVLVRCFI
jgi:hypothetical protein